MTLSKEVGLHAPRSLLATPLIMSLAQLIGTLSKDDDDVSENVAKKMNLRSFKLNHVY